MHKDNNPLECLTLRDDSGRSICDGARLEAGSITKLIWLHRGVPSASRNRIKHAGPCNSCRGGVEHRKNTPRNR